MGASGATRRGSHTDVQLEDSYRRYSGRPDDKRRVLVQSRHLLAVSLALLATAPATHAADLAEQRVAPEREPARESSHSHGLIAPETVCPSQVTIDAPRGAQLSVMRCLTDYARRNTGLADLSKARKLDRSAERKSADILRCDSFSHFACGRDFTYWMQRSGYLSVRCWRAGENLAWGTGKAGTVRSIFRAWMSSRGHRHNILARKYQQIGISVRVGSLGAYDHVRVWTQHFGTHCR